MSSDLPEKSKESSLTISLRVFGKERFQSMAGLARALGMKPQSLNPYLQGEKIPGPALMAKLGSIGFMQASAEHKPAELQIPSIKPSSFAAMSRTPEDLAEDVEATADQVRAWMAGSSQPSHRQLVLLFNELAKAATTLARCDCEGKHPELVSPHEAVA